MSLFEANVADLERELTWLVDVIDARFQQYFELTDRPATTWMQSGARLPPPPEPGESTFAAFVAEQNFAFDERLTLALALAPHLRPSLLDVFFTRNRTFDRRFTEFGCVQNGQAGDLWPTLETVAFLLGGVELGPRLRLMRMAEPGHAFQRLDLLRLAPAGSDEPLFRAPLVLREDWLQRFTIGVESPPVAGPQFPAHLVTTPLDWGDLVLHPSTHQQLEDLLIWVRHGRTLLRDWGMGRLLRPGYRTLFHGPPGTGKTITASIIAKMTGRELFRTDLSMIVSKYVGETEKNLGRVLDRAESKNWILFFDEADALFGKRSETRDAHDRYANQEVAFLLQRIETFNGVTILATNLRDNIDEAFARRFESQVYFPLPRAEERLRLWRQSLPPQAPLDDAIDLAEIARTHTLSGAGIANAVRHAALHALADGGRPIGHHHLLQAIRREQAKAGLVA